MKFIKIKGFVNKKMCILDEFYKLTNLHIHTHFMYARIQ